LTGITPHQYVRRARLREAAARLAVESEKVWMLRTIAVSATSRISTARSGVNLELKWKFRSITAISGGARSPAKWKR
jgi:hypothetical protein